MEKSAFGTFVYCRKRITSRGSSPWCPETHRQNSGDEMRLLMTVSLHGNGSEESGAMRGIGVSVVGCASRRIHSRILATTFRTPRGRWKRRHHSKAGPRPDRNERRGRILEVFDRGARPRARSGAATATGEFQSVVLLNLTFCMILQLQRLTLLYPTFKCTTDNARQWPDHCQLQSPRLISAAPENTMAITQLFH